MTEDGKWERELIEKLATAALKEQQRARRWGIFWKLLGFAYLTALLLVAMDFRWTKEPKADRHTAMIEISGLIAPGTDAVVLRINSPGGTPVQAQTIYDEIRRLRAKYPAIPLYAVVEDLCASGGYYVASAADRIYVARSSILGSIGVRMDGFGLTGLMEKLGIERRLLTAGENKAMLDPFLPLEESHRKIALGLLADIHQQFITAVREGRGERLKETPDMFTGMIWTGTRAIELGLADALGSLDYVAREIVKAEDIVDFTQKENLAEKFARRFGLGVAEGLERLGVRNGLALR